MQVMADPSREAHLDILGLLLHLASHRHVQIVQLMSRVPRRVLEMGPNVSPTHHSSSARQVACKVVLQ